MNTQIKYNIIYKLTKFKKFKLKRFKLIYNLVHTIKKFDS